MDGIREIAKAYYVRSSDKEKELAGEFFKKLDINQDGKVSLQEFKESVDSWIANENVFRQLDKNGNGTLDFNEVLTLYYMENKLVGKTKCDGCRELVIGRPFFSCSKCLEKYPNTFDLCVACYRKEKVAHQHPSHCLLDHHSLLTLLMKAKSQPKDGMREMARAQYERSSDKEKEKAREFCKKLDVNGDGKVRHCEVKKWMKSWLSDEKVFKQLDENGDGALDFYQVLALYYMQNTGGARKCDGCEILIVGPFFSCSHCLGKYNNTFDLCCTCYRKGSVEHEHPFNCFMNHHSIIYLLLRKAIAAAEKSQSKVIGASSVQMIKNADLEEVRKLGSGAFGTVYHGKWRGSDVAIKRLKKSCFSGNESEQERVTLEFWKETEILLTLHHPNIVACYGVVQDDVRGTLATVTEYMVDGSLKTALLRKHKNLDRGKKLIIAMDAAFGMEYLHSKNIVHFDLKCDNLLVNLRDGSRPICKVGDFGLSKIKQNTMISGGLQGTIPWMAPELLNSSRDKVTDKVDVFSFGIVLWEILTGEQPYANMHCVEIIRGVSSNKLRPAIPRHCDSDWSQLMEKCWDHNPASRPSFTEIATQLRNMSAALPR